MAPTLIGLPASAFTVTYTTPTKTLLVRVKGKIPGFWSGVTLKRETFMGGIKYSFSGFPLGGGGPKPDQDIDISVPEIVTLPMTRFNSDTVSIETGSGIYSINIQYDVPLEPTKPDKPSTSVVLPPIKKYLPLDEVLVITATIPAGRRSGVVIKFNDAYVRLVDATAHDDQIVWSLKWNKKPDDKDKTNPQLIEVHTDQWNGQPPPNSQTTHTIQGYVLYFVLHA